MKSYRQQNTLLPIEQLADASRRSAFYLSSSVDPDIYRDAGATKRQIKHELLLTFMANAKHQKRKPAPAKPRLLRTLLSLFI